MRARTTSIGVATTALAALALGTPAAAQYETRTQGERWASGNTEGQQQQDQQRQDQERRSRQQRQSAEDSWSSDSSRVIRPDTWIAVGYDLDGDGRFDVTEYVFGYDLMQAREQSRRRNGESGRTTARAGGMRSSSQAQEAGMRRDQGPQGSRTQEASARARREGRSSARPAVYETSGQIRSMRTVDLTAMKEPHVVAELETEQGRSARVELGPKPALSDLDLSQGDQIEVVGTIGKIDGRPLLMADRVRHQGRTVGIERPDDANLGRYQGTLRGLREVRYGGMEARHVQARVQLESGGTATVDLGPREKLKDLQLNAGDSIQFLADPVRIDGEPALRAEQVRSQGQVVDLERTVERQAYERSRRSNER